MGIGYDSTITPQSRLLPDKVKWAIVFYKRQGGSSTGVADIVSGDYGRPTLSRQAVGKVWGGYQQTKGISNGWGHQGRPSVLAAGDLDDIKSYLGGGPKQSINGVKVALDIGAGRPAINRHILSPGPKPHRAPKKIYIPPKNMGTRLEFANEMGDKTPNYWGGVISPDGPSFALANPNGRIFVRGGIGDGYEPGDIQFKSRSQTLMVWGAIPIKGVGPLARVDGIGGGETTLNGDRYLELLRGFFIRNFPELKDDKLIPQQDNAPSHRYHKVQEWFESKEIPKMAWPAQSPDLNIIESVWNHIKYQMKGETFTSKKKLWIRIQKEWDSLSKEFIVGLYESLERRISAVIDANGKQTKY